MEDSTIQETIGSLKEKVHEASNIAAARQRIIFKGAEVHNHVQMRAAGLADGAVVHLVERLIAPPEPGRQDAPPATTARPEQAGGPPSVAAATMGGGLEVVNTLVQQMIGGLLGPIPSGGGSPRSPGSPRAARGTPRYINGLEAVHGFMNAIGELDGVDDPPALLPIARSGVPLGHSNYEGVTRATTAILRAYEQQHGSLHAAITELSASQSIDTATADQIGALFTRVDQAYQAHVAASASATTGAAGAASGRTGAPGTAAETAAASPLGQSSAPATANADADVAAATDGSNAFNSQQVEDQMQLAVFAFALSMARSAQCVQRFAERISDRSQQLLLEVCREIGAGDRTFPASQSIMEQLGTATSRVSGLTLESAFLCSLYAQAVRGDHALLPDGMRPVVLQRDSQNRSAAPGSSATSVSAEAAPEATEGAGSAASTQTPAPGTAASLRSISINPGYAPLIIPHHSGHGSRFRMPAGVRSSVSVSGTPGQMEMFMSQGTDQAASDFIEEMLASGVISGTTAAEIRAARGTTAPGSESGTAGTAATAPADTASRAPSQPSAAAASPADGASNPAASDAMPPMQPLGGLPIFHSEGGGAQHAGAMAGPGIHVSSSVVTGGLPFGNGRGGAMDRPDGTVDVGGMIIQVELPPDGSASTPNVQTTGIGQLGSVLQNMMQEQLAAARMSQGRSTPAGGGQGPPGAASAAPGTVDPGTTTGTNPDAPPVQESAIPSQPLAPEPSSGSDLPQRVLQLTQRFVADLSHFETLPEAQRDAARQRMAQSYLRRVPQLLRDTVPGVAAGVDSFLNEIRGASGTPTAQHATAPASQSTPAAPPAAPPAAASGAAAPAEPSASAPPSVTPGPAAHALDLDSEDMSPTAPAEPSAPVLSSTAAAAATAAPPSSSAAGTSSGPGPSENAKPDRPEPKGLARGLKPKKPKGLGLGMASRAAPSTGTRSATAAGAGAGAGTASSLPTGGAAAAQSGGGSAPPSLDAILGSLGVNNGPGGNALMDAVSNVAQSPNIQRLIASPEMQQVAGQIESGSTDFASLFQQMMPVVGNLLGGGDGPGALNAGARGANQPAGTASARSTGAGASTGASDNAGGVPDIAAFREQMVGMMGESEAEQWMRRIIADRATMSQDSAGGNTEHSEIYNAGAIPDEGGKGFLGM